MLFPFESIKHFRAQLKINGVDVINCCCYEALLFRRGPGICGDGMAGTTGYVLLDLLPSEIKHWNNKVFKYVGPLHWLVPGVDCRDQFLEARTIYHRKRLHVLNYELCYSLVDLLDSVRITCVGLYIHGVDGSLSNLAKLGTSSKLSWYRCCTWHSFSIIW